MISIIDYGLGNVAAFLNMYKRMNVPARRVRTALEIADAKKIVLPGVGAFDHAMQLLDSSGMRGALEERVLGDRIPVIGVCVGMQILANRSEEGKGAGLGWIPGTVKHFNSLTRTADLPLPHMGWNDVTPREGAELFGSLEQNARFYFLHSFCFAPDNDSDAVATANYGAPFACAVRRDHIWGVQFHPEKSHHFGSVLLKNFAEI